MGGSKKRKAAKKKKASQLNTTVLQNKNNVVVENDELKNQEERHSDSGEKVVSPAILQGNPNPFTGGSEELERRDELSPVQSNSSETEGGDGVDIDGTQIVVEVEEVIKSESNEVECIEDVSELESKTDEQKLEVVLDAAADSLVSGESAAEVNDAVENSLVIDTVESVTAAVSEKVTTEYVENTKDSETMLNTSSKVEETTLDASAVSTLIVEQDEKPLPVSKGSSARAIDLVENTKSPETFQKNQQPLVAAPIPRLVVEKTSWLGCCGMFDLLRGGR